MEKYLQTLRSASNRSVLALLVGIAIVTGLMSFVLTASADARTWALGFLMNFSTEMLGAFATFILLDYIIGGRERRNQEEREALVRTKSALLRRLRSPNNRLSSAAADELRSHGWIADGSLRGAYLSHADLSQSNLKDADLQGARLFKAVFAGTVLQDAILEGSTVRVEQLALAASLCGAVMPDGRRYDGRLRLPGDVSNATRNGIAPDDAESMAGFFGVDLSDYQSGQSWADTQLELVKSAVTPSSALEWWHASSS